MRPILCPARIRVAVCGLLCTCAGVFALMLAVGTASAGADSVNWASGASIVAPANVNGSTPHITINAVSCPAAGECTAVGSYVDQSGSSQGLLATESGGTWQPGTTAQLPNSPNVDPDVDLTAVSCPAVGDCTAVGDYVDSSGGREGVILTEVGGAWTKATEVSDPGSTSVSGTPDVSLSAVSCPTSGDCLVVGGYFNSHGHSEGLLRFERNGSWTGFSFEATGADLPPNAAPELPASGPFLVVNLDSVSCAAGSPEQCVAAGTYTDSSGLQQGLLIKGVETSVGSSRVWSFTGTEPVLPADAAPTPNVTVASISCPALGECDAVGDYTDIDQTPQGLLLTETGGNWQDGTAPQLPADAGPGAGASLLSVSCVSVGDCDAVGYDSDVSVGSEQGLMLTDTSGTWGQGVEPAALPADAGSIPFTELLSVSCSAPSVCAAAGTYSDESFLARPLLLSQSGDGSWSSPAIEPALPGVLVQSDPGVEPISCAPAGGCAAVVDYTDAAGYTLAAAVNGTPDPPATPALSLTAPASTVTPGTPLALSASLSGGGGETGTVTFSVFGPQNSPPASCGFGATAVGSATVTGDGTYAPADDFTPTVAGDYWWYASYGGDLADSPTASVCGAAMAETVVASPPVQTATTTTTTTTTRPAPTPTKTTPTPPPKPTASLAAVKVKGAAVMVTVVCHATARQTCTGSLSLLVTESGSAPANAAKRVVVIGNSPYKLKGGTRRRLSVSLNRTGKSLLRSRHKLTARLRLTIDKQTTLARTVTFKRTKR
jgi:hypothetical protein